jgi:transposase
MAQRRKKGQEKLRGKIMEMVKQELKTLKAASLELCVSYSQAKRIYKRYLAGGDNALVHGSIGKPSHNKTDEDSVSKAIELFKEKYNDFGPTLAQEMLLERDGLKISVSTLRRALLAAGLWEQKKKSSEYRSRRAPRARFGELIQFDGSHHDWFEGRGPHCCLITMIDDARKIRISQFFDEETMFGAMILLKIWIERYGIPFALYCDKKNAFVLTREPTDAEILAGILKPKSHFGIACDKLGIEVITANSPQAKGRVERNHGVDQDRLIKTLRLEGICTIADANKYLLGTYLPKMNGKFSRPARDSDDAHVNMGKAKLDDILCMEFDRKIEPITIFV